MSSRSVGSEGISSKICETTSLGGGLVDAYQREVVKDESLRKVLSP